jgi:hypothetical protein
MKSKTLLSLLLIVVVAGTANAQSIQTGINFGGGVLNNIGTLGASALIILGALSAWREHNLTGLGGLLMLSGVAGMGIPIATQMFSAMSGSAVHITPTALPVILFW